VSYCKSRFGGIRIEPRNGRGSAGLSFYGVACLTSASPAKATANRRAGLIGSGGAAGHFIFRDEWVANHVKSAWSPTDLMR